MVLCDGTAKINVNFAYLSALINHLWQSTLFCGSRWTRDAAVCDATPVQIELPIHAVSSPTFLEPGICIPAVTLLPEGILDRARLRQSCAITLASG